MSANKDKTFEEVVAKYLSEGLHTRRGLGAEEYTALCRKAWDDCNASPEFPFKILTDPLSSVEHLRANRTADYIHWRVADGIEADREPSMEISCEAVGLFKPDLSTGPDDGPPLPTDEPETPETRRYLLAVFDVLGFSALLKENGLNEIIGLYTRLIAEAVTKEEMRTHTIVRLSKDTEATILGTLPVRHAHFSDTIFLWVPLVQGFIAPFMARCADMVCEALKLGLPLRGALAVGPAVMHSPTGTFVGTPIVEAARLEQSQDWLGVSLGDSMLAADVIREFDPQLVVHYPVPFKKDKPNIHAKLALDWPNRFRSRYGTDPIEALQAIDRSPAHHVYYENAIKFAKFSAGPIFRGEGLRPPNLGELANAAIEARRTGVALHRHHEFILKDLSRSGTAGEAVAHHVQSIAAGENPPSISDELPSHLHQYLRELSSAAQGTVKFIHLFPCTVEAVSMRLCGTPFSQEVEAMLTELEGLSEDGQQTAKFLRGLATGSKLAVPRKLPRRLGEHLKFALAWVNEGKVPLGVVRSIAEDCLEARLELCPLNQKADRILAAIEATSGIGPKLAFFLRGIAIGENPPVPPEIPEPIRSTLTSVSLASHLAGVQPSRALEILSVGLGDPQTGTDLFSLMEVLLAARKHDVEVPEDSELVIQKFEAAAPERAVVAQRLRSLITNRPLPSSPEVPPIAIGEILNQIEAMAMGETIPVDPSLVGLAAIRTRYGGGAMGDCILFSLRLMELAKDAETNALASYIRKIANRGAAGPAPLLTQPALAATAEEVRCLAEVGGFHWAFQQSRIAR